MRIWINEKIVNSIKKMILTILFIESVVVKKINEALIPTAHIKLKQIKEVSNSSTSSLKRKLSDCNNKRLDTYKVSVKLSIV
ncbi:hypothetical protein RR00_16210 [Acinetobacter baumannii]|uniref:Uncharacterized protein n=8 Tax=Acinetobacter baumannii TaxID=470 RepID=A0A1L6EKG2_ACIBA|nr:hypothetical protein [Acinetobacter baumannii]EGT92894.1 hypothetical protein ABNIH3_15811 [Acinetobacter baumannii ABNIH3]EJG16436.1 hypothetical protein ACIN5143_A4356 [Acinetobacter baumannii OIFC143]EKA72727.1 hypothetical protein ACINWC692_A0177 [Acinetobacter baumannii WC-692]EKK08114.1 hypothetical protein ACINIS235_A0138 [Acinetobacter baumannii IS-235]EKK18304.1 hypothetical protein ACINIS251_A0079 [Acinetobacter baumannii IS-251]EKL59842.1 hypothetical protein ACIN5110_A0098 [Aci